MNDRKLLSLGVAGTVIAAVSCITSMLVVPLALIGLSAWAGWADYGLVVVMAAFAVIAVTAGWRVLRGPHAP